MKLFVTGETLPDPAKWSIWSEWSLVIANDLDDAMKITGDATGCEIPMDKPLHLVQMPEPNWGDDI